MTAMPHHTKYSPYYGMTRERSPRTVRQCCLSVAEQYSDTPLVEQDYPCRLQSRDPPARAAPLGV
jgi:hypothetical protein